MRIRPTRIRRNTVPNHGCEEEEGWSLLVKIEGDPEVQEEQHKVKVEERL